MKKLVKINHIKLQNSRHVQELLQSHENSINPTLSLIYMLHWGIITTEENLILPFYCSRRDRVAKQISREWFPHCNSQPKPNCRMASFRDRQTNKPSLRKFLSCCNNSLCGKTILLVYFPCWSTCAKPVNTYRLTFASNKFLPPKC